MIYKSFASEVVSVPTSDMVIGGDTAVNPDIKSGNPISL